MSTDDPKPLIPDPQEVSGTPYSIAGSPVMRNGLGISNA
jgi:hypothetical protein